MASGQLGEIAGVPADIASDIMHRTVETLSKNKGGEFAWGDAQALLRDEHKLKDNVLSAFMWALVRRTPGIERVSRGRYRVAGDPALCKHRDWRFSLGRVDVEGASILNDLLAEYQGGSSTLDSLKGRLSGALGSLGV
mgnify:FL=1